jgi:hypothetical protein
MRRLFLLSLVSVFALNAVARGETPAKLKVILYNDKGSFGLGVPRITEILGKRDDIQLVTLNAEQLRSQDWSDAQVVIFSGGETSTLVALATDGPRELLHAFESYARHVIRLSSGLFPWQRT